MAAVPRFSANIGFLWPEVSIPDRIRAAGRSGFSAVECHLPYAHSVEEIIDSLGEADLPLLSLNTILGDEGDFGLTALPGREAQARAAIDQAVDFAAAVGCANVNVLAGITGRSSEAEDTLRDNLTYASAAATERSVGLLLEPMSARAVPGAHLSRVEHALETIQAVGSSNIKIMVDLFHTQCMQGDLIEITRTTLPYLGHIQFAAVPDRHEPDHGEVDYTWLLPEILQMGYTGYFGAEYHPRTTTEAGLGWLDNFAAPTAADTKGTT